MAFTFKNLAMLFAQAVFIKAKPFTPMSIRAIMSTPYPF